MWPRSVTAMAGDNVKKRSSYRVRSDVVKIDCHLFKIEIPDVLVEFITTVNGCLCQYICKKKNIQKNDCLVYVWETERPEIIYLRQ